MIRMKLGVKESFDQPLLEGLEQDVDQDKDRTDGPVRNELTCTKLNI
jgi:hypothetical protein